MFKHSEIKKLKREFGRLGVVLDSKTSTGSSHFKWNFTAWTGETFHVITSRTPRRRQNAGRAFMRDVKHAVKALK